MFTKSGMALPKAQLKFLVTLPFLATYNLMTHPPFAPAPRLVNDRSLSVNYYNILHTFLPFIKHFFDRPIFLEEIC